jgi:hypothetical protein
MATTGGTRFEPVLVGSRRRTGFARLSIAVWLTILVGVVAIAFVGRLGAPGSAVDRNPEASAPGTDVGGVPAVAASGAPESALNGTAAGPAPADIAVFDVVSGTATIHVDGAIGRHSIFTIKVAVETLDGNVATSRTIGVADPDGGVRPDRQRTFAVTFDVERAQARGPAWVAVTAYDAIGAQIGTVVELYGSGFRNVPLRIDGTFVR